MCKHALTLTFRVGQSFSQIASEHAFLASVRVEDPEGLPLCLHARTCVHERGNEALLLPPTQHPCLNPLPLRSPSQQGFLCCACSRSCCVSLSSTLPNSHTVPYKHFFVSPTASLPSVCHVLSFCVTLRDCGFFSSLSPR